LDAPDEGVSSLIDTWVLIREIESNGERNRGVYVLKSRGINHSKKVREFVISNKGLDLIGYKDKKLMGARIELKKAINTKQRPSKVIKKSRKKNNIKKKK
jgi:circadian clock protein KaiC